MEWDDLVWKATAAYNFFPTESSGMVPFFLMFGREANVKHNLLASEKTKIHGDRRKHDKPRTNEQTVLSHST